MGERFHRFELSTSISDKNKEPAWLVAERAQAVERFTSLPMPDPTVEAWRHTDITALDIDAYHRAGVIEVSASSDDGVVVSSFEGALREHEDLFRAHLGTVGGPESDAKLRALTTAYGTGIFVYVPRGVVVERPIELAAKIKGGTALLPRVLLVADEGAEVTLIERYSPGKGWDHGLCVPVVEIIARQGAHVRHLTVQDHAQTVTHLAQTRALIGRDASVRSLVASFGGGLARTVTEAVLNGQGGHAELLGVCFGDHDQHLDHRTLQLHEAPNTTSEVYYKGALKGRARSVYSGLVDLEKDGTQADAQQTNRNLLLSEHAHADATPFLEIKTSEVARATHAVSVGRPDDSVLFYLRSRGLDRPEAERMFVQGFFQEIIDRVRDEQVTATLETAVQAELELEDE